MTMLTVKPETGRLTFPRFSNLFDTLFESEISQMNPNNFLKTPTLVNVKDTKESYLVEVAAPGFAKENFDIKVENGILLISGEVKSETTETEEKFTRKEFNFSSFSRSFTLPKTVEAAKISATYEQGILKVTLPKKEEAKEPSAIEVKVS